MSTLDPRRGPLHGRLLYHHAGYRGPPRGSRGGDPAGRGYGDRGQPGEKPGRTAGQAFPFLQGAVQAHRDRGRQSKRKPGLRPQVIPKTTGPPRKAPGRTD